MRTASPIVTEEADESTLVPGLFLAGPMVHHRGVRFCFIYKFRQRFAIVANAIAQRLGMDTTEPSRPAGTWECTSTTSPAARNPVCAKRSDINVAAPGATLLLGRENVGKVHAGPCPDGQPARSANFRGTTVSCREYAVDGRVFVDTPGLHRASDADTVRLTLEALAGADEVLLVASATQLDEDLDLLLPLVQGEAGEHRRDALGPRRRPCRRSRSDRAHGAGDRPAHRGARRAPSRCRSARGIAGSRRGARRRPP